jgi:hypothetical protein
MEPCTTILAVLRNAQSILLLAEKENVPTARWSCTTVNVHVFVVKDDVCEYGTRAAAARKLAKAVRLNAIASPPQVSIY